MERSHTVFLYGTLLPVVAPADATKIVSRMRCVGPARVRGALYDLGAYPGALLDGNVTGTIRGVLFNVSGTTLSEMDRYERYRKDDPGQSLFLRRECEAQAADGNRVRCWIYVYNRDIGGAARIQDGDYRRWRQRKRSRDR